MRLLWSLLGGLLAWLLLLLDVLLGCLLGGLSSCSLGDLLNVFVFTNYLDLLLRGFLGLLLSLAIWGDLIMLQGSLGSLGYLYGVTKYPRLSGFTCTSLTGKVFGPGYLRLALILLWALYRLIICLFLASFRLYLA